jgi:hypothetical protein
MYVSYLQSFSFIITVTFQADATQYPGQFGGDDELPPAFFHGMETDVDVRNQHLCHLVIFKTSQPPQAGDTHLRSFANALLAHISSLLHHFQHENGESTELPPPSWPSVSHLRALPTRLSSFIHSSPLENDAPDELQHPSTPSRVDPRRLLASLSSFLHRSRLNTASEAEPHPTTSSSSRPDAPITRLSSLFRSQPHTDKEIKLAQLPSQPHVVEVAAVRDKQVCPLDEFTFAMVS